MAELSGLTIIDKENTDGDIKIEFIGLRPGEKMYEELLINRKSSKTSHSKIIKGIEDFIPYNVLLKKINTLKVNLEKNDIELIKASLKKIVKEFSEVNKIEDEIFKKQLDVS